MALDLVYELGRPNGPQRVADEVNSLDIDRLRGVATSLATLAWTAAMKLVERGSHASFDDLLAYWRAQVTSNSDPEGQ